MKKIKEYLKVKNNDFVEGSIISSICLIFSKLLGIIYVIPFYLIIGTYGGSLYSYGYNIYNLFLNISTSGIPSSINKIVSEYNTKKQYDLKEYSYKLGKIIIIIISLACFIIMFFFSDNIIYLIIKDDVNSSNINDISVIIKSISFCILIIPILSIYRSYLQGHKIISITFISQIIEQIVRIFVILVGSYIVIKVLNMDVTYGVCIALFGALVGGITAYFYLKLKMHNKKELLNKNSIEISVDKKIILKKILTYAIPFTIISISSNIYTITDFSLVIRGLTEINYNINEAQEVASVITTWASKICTIITSIGVGISVNIIPNVVNNYINKNYDNLNRNFNQAINIIILASLPITIGISILSNEIYYLFYGASLYGGNILKYLCFTSLLSSVHIILNMILQGLNKYKIIFLNTFLGIAINALLDIPLIKLFNNIGIYPYYGAILSTIIGYLVSFIIIFVYLKKTMKFSYENICRTLKNISIPLLIMPIALIGLHKFLKININSRFIQVPVILIYTLIGMVIFFIIVYKNKYLKSLYTALLKNK